MRHDLLLAWNPDLWIDVRLIQGLVILRKNTFLHLSVASRTSNNKRVHGCILPPSSLKRQIEERGIRAVASRLGMNGWWLNVVEDAELGYGQLAVKSGQHPK